MIGVYGLLIEVYSVGATIVSSGLSLSVTRIISENIITCTYSLRKVMKVCILIGIFLSLIISVSLFCISSPLSIIILHERRASIPLKILCFNLPILSFSACLKGYFYATHKSFYSMAEQIIEQIIEVIIFIFIEKIFSVKGVELTSIALALSSVMAEIFALLYSFFLYFIDVRKYCKNENYCDYKKIIRCVLDIALPTTFSSLIGSILSTAENLLIPIGLQKYGLTKEYSLKVYGILTGIVAPVISFPNSLFLAVMTLIVPEISQAVLIGGKNSANKMAYKVLKPSMAFSLIIFVAFFEFANDISEIIYKTPLYGGYIKIFSPIILPVCIISVTTGALRGLGEQKRLLFLTVIVSCVKLVLTLSIVPFMAIKGIVIVSFIGAILEAVLSLLSLNRRE